MMCKYHLTSILGATLFVAGVALPLAAEEKAADPKVFHEDFEQGMNRWVMTDAKVWSGVEDEGDHALSLTGSSDYAPPVRSPLNIARIKDFKAGSFVADIQAKQTGREYGHRDLCFFFGYQDPSHFYYVHLATKADEHANSIFLVNGAPRVSIAKTRTDGTDWANGYHHIRLVRNVESGSVEVFFDDMSKAVMTAEDKTFGEGGFGVGSFDDTGNFDDITVAPLTADETAPPAKEKP